jgi:hypothetical protein
MHEADFQNWLNHARSVGYTDTEIRTMLLKAGWSYQHVNELMRERGLTPGTAHPNRRGHVVKHASEQKSIVLGMTMSVGVMLIAVTVLLYIVLR